jgi:hypothetical protein
MRSLAPLLLAGAIALPAAGATKFTFECRNNGSVPYTFRGRAVVEGANARYDVTEGAHPLFNPQMSVISKDRGSILMVMDHRQKTYFMRTTDFMSGQLSLWKGPGKTKESRHEVLVSRDGEQVTIAGHPTTKYTLRAGYNLGMEVEGERLKGRVEAVASFWMMAGSLETALPYGLHFGFKPGFPAIDAEVARALAGKGIPLREVISVTRTIADGPTITESFILEVTEVAEEPVEAAAFAPPPGYVYREPSFGFQSQ